MKLNLVIHPGEALQARLIQHLQSRLSAGEELKSIALNTWSPADPSRMPGRSGSAPITILLTRPPAGALEKQADQILVLAEQQADAYRLLGAASGLDALLRRSPCTRFALVQATDTVGEQLCWRPLLEMGVPSYGRWQRQQEHLLAAIADGLLWWIRLCEQQGRLVVLEDAHAERPPSLPLRAAPRLQPWKPLAAEVLRVGYGVLRRLQQLGSREPRHWRIAVGQFSPERDQLQLLHHLPPDARGWYADPQLVSDGERCWLFCERLASELHRGVIDLFALDAGGLRACGTVIEEPFHLSFPRVFRHQGQWYATVESADQREVRLYEALAFPHRWRLRRRLLQGEAWIDPVLLPLAQGWALLVSRSASLPSQPREIAGELQLFVSEDLLSGDFQPHPASPLLLDSLAGRNGGLLELDQQHYRVAQQTGFDGAYGEAVQLRRIEMIDRQHYREHRTCPPWLHRLKRALKASHLHTLNNCGSWVALDYRPR